MRRVGYEFKLINLQLSLGTNLKFYRSAGKGLKLKVRYICQIIPTFAEVTEAGRLIINVVVKYQRQFLSSSVGVVALPISCNIE